MKYNLLALYPGEQAEAIAKHYAAHAKIAMELRRLCDMRSYNSGSTELEPIINYLVDQIKQNHSCDLGIALEWSVTNEQKTKGVANDK
jgi:hypothetical protein